MRQRYAVAKSAAPVHRGAMHLALGCALLAIASVSAASAEERTGPPVVVDVNRPRSPFDCSLPIGIQWYGSRQVCLQYLCGGRNVYNEYLFDADNRRRKNPCYGQSPTDFGEQFD
jgi:hypothetical protein